MRNQNFGQNFKKPQMNVYNIASEFDIVHKLEFKMFMFIT